MFGLLLAIFLSPLLQDDATAPDEAVVAMDALQAEALPEAQADRQLPSVLEDVPLQDRLEQPLGWVRIRFRERLISFSAYSAGSAKADLDGILADSDRRGAALMALGCSKAAGVRLTLESWAVGGGLLERRAAILALGELGGQSLDFLLALAADADARVAECALLAMLRLNANVARSEVEAIAEDRTSTYSKTARKLLEVMDTPSKDSVPESLKLLFELRWDAALSYGLVGGKSRSQLRIEELVSHAEFLNAVVLRASLNLSMPGVDDHILALIETGDAEAIRVAVTRIPRTLSTRFESELWAPANSEEWRLVLEAIENAGADEAAFPLASGALQLPQFRSRAAGLMIAMGDEAAPSLLLESLYDGELESRIAACRSFGKVTDSRWSTELAKLRRTDPNSRLAMTALVAQMRMGYKPADVVVRSIVLDGTQIQRELLVDELLAVGSDPSIPVLLEAAYSHMIGRRRLRVATQLVERGRVLPRAELITALESGDEPDLANTFVRALRKNLSVNELQAFASLFPANGVEVNIELALALIEHDHIVGLSLLTRALWSPPLDLSSLAGAVIVRARGISRLHQELNSPPARVSVGGIRRVGFALGEWGGVEALEELASQRPSHDPALQGAYLGAMSARTQ
ncbi:MAG: hypothetical protein ACI8TQ_000947 [Planctomycetota bacterium]|jgi:hypothetical protein